MLRNTARARKSRLRLIVLCSRRKYEKKVDKSTNRGYNKERLTCQLFWFNKQRKRRRDMLSRFELFSFTISSIYGYIQKIEREEMEKYGLKGACAQYLLAMNRYEEGVTAAKLSEICDKDKAAVSRVITDMEKKGLVKRVCPNDNAYRALLKLTPEGKKAVEFVGEKAKVAVEYAGGGLSEENRKIFYESLQLIAANIQTLYKEGIPEHE